MRSRHLAIPVVLISMLACADAEFRGTSYPPEVAMPIDLVDHVGNAWSLDQANGKIVVLFFGFAHCPDVCPTTLSRWVRAQEALGARADEVEWVFVTVDPDRDTGDRLADHLGAFDEGFIGLTGERPALESVYRSYGVHHQRRAIEGSASGYLVDHTSHLYLLDRAGRLRVTIGFDAPVEDLVHDLKLLLREPGEALSLNVREAWSRPAPAGAVGVVYAEIENAGKSEDRLLSAASARCASIEIHRTIQNDGWVSMKPVEDGVSIPPGETVAFEPGGLHLMLFNLKEDLTPGATFEIELTFEHAGTLTAAVEVGGEDG